ncbi:hypothetical protein TNCV_399681 [Trichonephila clavipes]|nr:hypothetical protein TNCV_399681 [Trichonephila clavipes]
MSRILKQLKVNGPCHSEPKSSEEEDASSGFGKSAKEIHQALKEVYKDEAITSKGVYEWFKHFRRHLRKIFGQKNLT